MLGYTPIGPSTISKSSSSLDNFALSVTTNQFTSNSSSKILFSCQNYIFCQGKLTESSYSDDEYDYVVTTKRRTSKLPKENSSIIINNV